MAWNTTAAVRWNTKFALYRWLIALLFILFIVPLSEEFKHILQPVLRSRSHHKEFWDRPKKIVTMPELSKEKLLRNNVFNDCHLSGTGTVYVVRCIIYIKSCIFLSCNKKSLFFRFLSSAKLLNTAITRAQSLGTCNVVIIKDLSW